jgi:RNA polymerase sigma-32 factor
MVDFEINKTQNIENDCIENEGDVDFLGSEGINSEDSFSNVALSKNSELSSINGNQLTKYVNEVVNIPSLTQQEEIDLIKDYQENGNKFSAHKVIKSHLKLVVKIAFSYKNYGLVMLDVICEGNLGLLKALEKFDAKKGFRFSTYASWWIKSSISEFILDSWSLVKMSNTRAKKLLFFNLSRIKKFLGLKNRGILSREDIKKIADCVDVSVDDVAAISNTRSYSIDESLNEDGFSMKDCLADSSDIAKEFEIDDDKNKKRKIIKDAMNSLSEREIKIIQMRYLQEKSTTLEDISKIMNISKERVRQIEGNAIKKIISYTRSI